MNFYQYKGDGSTVRVGGWQYAPEALRESLEAGGSLWEITINRGGQVLTTVQRG